jgi:hypothetical protein
MRTRMSCLLGLVALLLASPAMSQTDMPTQTVTGTVVSSTSDSLVIKLDTGAERTFKVDTTSNLPASLASGQRVTVRFHAMSGGDHAAQVTLAGGTNPPAGGMSPGTADTSSSGQLPATAGPVPALMLAGFSALAAGLALRRASRSRA